MSKPTNFSYSNTLISTRYPLVSTKGPNTNTGMYESSSAIMGGFSRPNVNLGNAPQTSPETNYNNAVNFVGVNADANRRRANPIKHWRRQLQVNGKSGRSNASISVVDRPGGTVFRGYTPIDSDCKCSVEGNNIFITFDNKYLQSTSKTIKPQPSNTSNTKIQNNGFIQVGAVDGADSYQIQTGVYNTKTTCCSEPKKSLDKIRTNSAISKSYYSDTKAYLKSRCNTFSQKQSITKIADNTYATTTNPYQGSTQYSTNNCTNPMNNKECTNVTYYNPNNVQYAQQGAVDSSTRLARLNYNTITKNGASFNSANGSQYASAGNYHGESFSRYFIKNKNSPPLIWRRNGNKNVCNTNCTGGVQTTTTNNTPLLGGGPSIPSIPDDTPMEVNLYITDSNLTDEFHLRNGDALINGPRYGTIAISNTTGIYTYTGSTPLQTNGELIDTFIFSQGAGQGSTTFFVRAN